MKFRVRYMLWCKAPCMSCKASPLMHDIHLRSRGNAGHDAPTWLHSVQLLADIDDSGDPVPKHRCENLDRLTATN